jgi:hypothetical protein
MANPRYRITMQAALHTRPPTKTELAEQEEERRLQSEAESSDYVRPESSDEFQSNDS